MRPILGLLLVVAACGGGGGTTDGDDAAEDASVGPHPDGEVPVGCDDSGDAAECNNCIDDDHDGRIDGEDIECTGAIDDDESSFATGIPGDNQDETWQDCFYDGNSGGGQDCRFNVCCMFDPDCPDDPTSCEATAECIEYCEPLVPPNCDCFGCCTMCDDAGCEDIYINPAVAPDCDETTIHDEALCPRCEKSADCGTQCEGTTDCDADTACPDNQFCSDGCCIAVVE